MSASQAIPAAFRVSALVTGAVLWLALSSGPLIWIFPLNIVLTGLVTHFSTKAVRAVVPVPEVRWAGVLAVFAGSALVAYVAVYGDPALKLMAASYAALNVTVFALIVWLNVRVVHSGA